jgi:hypothetical protein
MRTVEYQHLPNGDVAIVRRTDNEAIVARYWRDTSPVEWRRAGEVPQLREAILALMLRPESDDRDRVVDFALWALGHENPMSDESWREWIKPKLPSVFSIVCAGRPPTR